MTALASDDPAVRSKALDDLVTLGDSVLPRLADRLSVERDADLRSSIETAIDRIEIHAARKRFPLRGDELRIYRFGPFESGRVTVKVITAQSPTWLDGLNFVLQISNAGEAPVDVEWFRIKDPKRDWEMLEFQSWTATDLGWSTSMNLPALHLNRGETWAEHFDRTPDIRDHLPKPAFIRLFLNANLLQGERRGKLKIGDENLFKLEMRPVEDKDLDAAAKEILSLANGELKDPQRKRLMYLLRCDERPHSRLHATDLKSAYEGSTRGDLGSSQILLGALVDKIPDDEALSYLLARVRGGDAVPLGWYKQWLIPGLVDEIPAFLDSKNRYARLLAMEAIIDQGKLVRQDRIVELLEDDDWYIRRRALEAAAKFKIPCAAKIARLLKDSEQTPALAAQVLVALGARDQLPAVREALQSFKGEDTWQVRAEFIRSIAALGGTADLIRPHLDSEEQYAREAAIRALGDLKSAGDTERVREFLKSDQSTDVQAVLYFLGKMRRNEDVETVVHEAFDNPLVWDDALGALKEMGMEDALFALKSLAIDRGDDYWTPRGDAVDAYAAALPEDRRAKELIEILRHPKSTPSVRERAIVHLGPMGAEAAKATQAALDESGVGLWAMWELSRYSAPKRFASPPAIRVPLRMTVIVSDALKRLPVPAKIEGMTHLGKRELFYRTPNVSLEIFLYHVCASEDNSAGFIFTDDEVRVVPRLQAIEFYRKLKIE